MKNFRHLLLLIAVLFTVQSFAQTDPPSRTRADDTFTQVDEYMTALKRLGIPTASSDVLVGTTTPQNTAKLIWNTTLNKLRIYNPVDQIWRDALEADLTNYYTKAEIDALFANETLQQVTDRGNSTSNVIQLTGAGGFDISKNGLVVFGNGAGTGQILNLMNSGILTQIDLAATGSGITQGASKINLYPESPTVAGVITSNRVSALPALNNNELVTLGQLSDSLSNIPTKTPTLQEVTDQGNTTNNFLSVTSLSGSSSLDLSVVGDEARISSGFFGGPILVETGQSVMTLDGAKASFTDGSMSFINVQGSDPVSDDDLTTKRYVDSQGLLFLENNSIIDKRTSLESFANDGVLIGRQASFGSSGASFSNMIGYRSGYMSSDLQSSNSLGYESGYNSINSGYSNFIGYRAGSTTNGARFSNIIGYKSGESFTDNSIGRNNIIIGTNISLPNGYSDRINIGGVIFGSGSYFEEFGTPSITPTPNGKIGVGVVSPLKTFEVNGTAGYTSTPTLDALSFATKAYVDDNSIFTLVGSSVLDRRTSNTGTSGESTFIGVNSGSGATNANSSNFFGRVSGSGATNASNSNFFGNQAGLSATNASGSNFFGSAAGDGATNASNSNFFGYDSGSGALRALSSNFFGTSAGASATDAHNSNFIGSGAGVGATNSSRSNFFGSAAGDGATSAPYSNLFGFKTGASFSGNNIGANNIIIGSNISLPNSTSNSLNIGGVLYGTGLNSITSGNPSITPTVNGKIGVGVISPTKAFEVNGTAGYTSTPTLDVLSFANKGYVDANYLPLTGGSISGNLNLTSGSMELTGNQIVSFKNETNQRIGYTGKASPASNQMWLVSDIADLNVRAGSGFKVNIPSSTSITPSNASIGGSNSFNFYTTGTPSAGAGSVFVGTNFSSAASFLLRNYAVSGYQLTLNDGGLSTVGDVQARGTILTSDSTLKNKIEYNPDATNIQPFSYTWKEGSDTTRKHYGYSAQDVEAVMPDAVYTNEEGFKSLNYIEVLVAKIKALEDRLKALEAKLEESE